MIDFRERPLMLTFRDTIFGDGFLASITLHGRALISQEDDGKWWMYGARPAGMVASGYTVVEAFLRFRNRYRETLLDIAQETNSFGAFKTEVERFFYEADACNDDDRLWEVATRNENTAPLEPFFGLPRESPESSPSQITVERLDEAGKSFTASDNVTDKYSIAQASA